MTAIRLFSMVGERRCGNTDRRQLPRGGRRLVDEVRLVVFEMLLSFVAVT